MNLSKLKDLRSEDFEQRLFVRIFLKRLHHSAATAGITITSVKLSDLYFNSNFAVRYAVRLLVSTVSPIL